MPGEPTVIYSAASTQQAWLLKNLLSECGITAWVVNDAIQLGGGELPIGWTAAARVVVSADDAADARRVAEAFDQQTAYASRETHDREGTAVADSSLVSGDDQADDDQWSDWPCCPRCGERRSARCPICETSGSDFPLADFQEHAGGQRVLLMCRTCDDHMIPEWYRRCPRCGYDYGDGIEIQQPTHEPIDLNPRLWIVLALLAAASLAAAAYFAWLFRWT
jgi:uncharacterized paraquat-inducible protein A